MRRSRSTVSWSPRPTLRTLITASASAASERPSIASALCSTSASSAPSFAPGKCVGPPRPAARFAARGRTDGGGRRSAGRAARGSSSSRRSGHDRCGPRRRGARAARRRTHRGSGRLNPPERGRRAGEQGRRADEHHATARNGVVDSTPRGNGCHEDDAVGRLLSRPIRSARDFSRQKQLRASTRRSLAFPGRTSRASKQDRHMR